MLSTARLLVESRVPHRSCPYWPSLHLPAPNQPVCATGMMIFVTLFVHWRYVPLAMHPDFWQFLDLEWHPIDSSRLIPCNWLQLTNRWLSPTACHTCFLDYCHIQFVWGCLQLPFGWHWLVMTCLRIKKLKQLFVLGCRLAIIAELHPLQLHHFVHLRLHCIGEERIEIVLIGYCTLFILISFLHS